MSKKTFGTPSETNQNEAIAIENFKKTHTAVDMLGNEFEVDEILYELMTGEEKPVDVDRVLGTVRHLQGKILTVVDAVMEDKVRAKYVKDLVREAFSNTSNWIYEMSVRGFENDDVGEHEHEYEPLNSTITPENTTLRN